MVTIQALRDEISAQHQQLLCHPLFSAVHDLADLRLFMQWHVFAVWDFMSLVKRLQAELSGVTLPWLPPAHPRAARLINEIVLGEESDTTPRGPLSHFELYLGAMREIGAATDAIDNFIALLRSGVPVPVALAAVDAPAPLRRFVGQTIEVCVGRPRNGVLGNFFYGRENVIPGMFERLMQQWRIGPGQAPTMMFYLQRHIEVDSGEHGPAAQQLIIDLSGGTPHALAEVLEAGLAAIGERQRLWDGLLAAIEAARAGRRLQSEPAASGAFG